MHEAESSIAEVLAPAKINLCLHVGPRQADGFHPVCSLMDRVTLADTVQIRRDPGEGIRLIVSGRGDIPPEENIVVRAARALEQATGERLDAFIELYKQIPLAAGLGGGSSDAAAALKLLVFLFELDIGDQELMAIAGGLGADVPFFLTDGPQLAAGRGELLTPVTFGFEYMAVVVNPGRMLRTADVYKLYDEMESAGGLPFEERAASLDSLDAILELLHNDLAAAATRLCPEIGDIEDALRAAGADGILVSGSGPSVFGIFTDEEAAGRAGAAITGRFPPTWSVKPVPRHPQIP